MQVHDTISVRSVLSTPSPVEEEPVAPDGFEVAASPVAPSLAPSVDYAAMEEVPVEVAHDPSVAPVLPTLDELMRQQRTRLQGADARELVVDRMQKAERVLRRDTLEALPEWAAGKASFPWADAQRSADVQALARALNLTLPASSEEAQARRLRFERMEKEGFEETARVAGIPADAIEHILAGRNEEDRYDRFDDYHRTAEGLEGFEEVVADALVFGTPAGEGALAWSDNAVERQVAFGVNVGVLSDAVLADIDDAADALFAGSDTLSAEGLATAVALRVSPDRLSEVEQQQIIGATSFVNLGADVDTRRERAAQVIASFVTLDRAGRPPTLRRELERDVLAVHENLTGGHKHYEAVARVVGVPGEHKQALGDGFEFELTNDANGEAQWGRHWKEDQGVFQTIASIALSVASFIPSPIAPFAQAANAVMGAVQAVKSGNVLGIVGAGLGVVTSLAGAVGRGLGAAAGKAIDIAKKGLGAVRAVVSGDPLAIAGAVAGLSNDPLAQRAGAGLDIAGAVKSGDPAGIVDAFLGAAKVERSLQTAPSQVVLPPSEAELQAEPLPPGLEGVDLAALDAHIFGGEGVRLAADGLLALRFGAHGLPAVEGVPTVDVDQRTQAELDAIVAQTPQLNDAGVTITREGVFAGGELLFGPGEEVLFTEADGFLQAATLDGSDEAGWVGRYVFFEDGALLPFDGLAGAGGVPSEETMRTNLFAGGGVYFPEETVETQHYLRQVLGFDFSLDAAGTTLIIAHDGDEVARQAVNPGSLFDVVEGPDDELPQVQLTVTNAEGGSRRLLLSPLGTVTNADPDTPPPSGWRFDDLPR
ncbi:MAG: hypothetical protein RIT81_17750 [Deltaproteobacteria bacterium]